MRYFAMIDGERRGPFELSELTQAGVRPDTYVWCKGMADWEKAEDVADICRYYRQTIFDRMHPSLSKRSPKAPAPAPGPQQGADPYAEVPWRFRGIVHRSGQIPEFTPDNPDTSRPPLPTLTIALILTIFCFPPTGLVAIVFSYKARHAWAQSLKTEGKEAEKLRAEAHDMGRRAKMWVGITFFLGMIFYAFLVNTNT